jgi:hypothetical protein
MPSDRAFQALNAVADVIAQDDSRKSFVGDPHATVGHEVLQHLPESVLEKLGQLSEGELKHLAELRATLIEAGLGVDAPGGYTACVL